jgi:hypothetical protein
MLDFFLARWVSRDPIAGILEKPCSWVLPRIVTHIPYILLVFASTRRPRLGP